MKVLKSKERTRYGKATGEEWIYFVLHNLLSMLLFIFTLWKLGLYNKDYNTFFGFLQYLSILLALSYFFGLLSRLLVYIPLRIYFNEHNKTVLSFWNINSGINEFISVPYFIRTLLSMGLFAIFGKLFPNEPFESTIGVYLGLKLLIYLYTYVKYK